MALVRIFVKLEVGNIRIYITLNVQNMKESSQLCIVYIPCKNGQDFLDIQYLYTYEDMNGRAEGGPAALPTAEAESRSSSSGATTAPQERACAASTAVPSGADLARSGGPATGSPASRTGGPGSGSSAPLPAVKQGPSSGNYNIFQLDVFSGSMQGSLLMPPLINKLATYLILHCCYDHI